MSLKTILYTKFCFITGLPSV